MYHTSPDKHGGDFVFEIHIDFHRYVSTFFQESKVKILPLFTIHVFQLISQGGTDIHTKCPCFHGFLIHGRAYNT